MTVCDQLVKPTMPPSFRYWTCIKQEPGTENFNTCRKNPSPKADQQWLFSFTYPSMVLFQQLCLFHATLCDFLVVEKNSPKVIFWIWQIASCLGSAWTLAHLAEALQSLQSGGCHNSDISPLCIPFVTRKSSLQCLHHSGIGLASNKSLALDNAHICRKEPSQKEKEILSRKRVFVACNVRNVLLVTSDVYGILLAHVGAYLTKGQADGHRSRWFKPNIITVDCTSKSQKFSWNYGQIHRSVLQSTILSVLQEGANS